MASLDKPLPPINTQDQQLAAQQQTQTQVQAQAQAQAQAQVQAQPQVAQQQQVQPQQPVTQQQQPQSEPQQQQQQPPLQQLQQPQLQMPQQMSQQPYYGGSGSPSPYGSVPPSPHSAPYGSQQFGYGQMAPPSFPGQPAIQGQVQQDPYYQQSVAPQAGPYPQQANYSQQPAGYPPQSYPPQNYPPPGPPQGYPPPPQGYPPPPQGYPPPPQGYPPQGYLPQGYPPQGYPQGYPPQDYSLQAPQQILPMHGQFGPITRPVSEGYAPIFAQDYMPQRDAVVICKALSSTDDDALIRTLPSLTPAQLISIHHYLLNENKPSIVVSELLEKKIKSTFKDAIRAVVLGPLEFDVWLLNRATEGFGKNEIFLSMVLLSRKNGDIEAIKGAYLRKYGKHLVDVIRKELSGQLEDLFMNALEARRADENVPVNDAQVESDANELYTAMVGKSEGNKVSEILVTRSDAMLRKIISKYDGMPHGKPLEKMIEKKFGGSLKTALLYILHCAKDRALMEARALELTMKGMGTKDEELTYRLAILHWDKDFLRSVKKEYLKEFPTKSKGGLAARVKGETSGNYGKFLLALLEVS